MNSYKNHTLYEFVLNLYNNCMNLYELVLYNLYTICTVQIVLYEFVLYNLYNIKKRNKNSHGIPTHALITT
jgi:hypothetical protein